MKETCLVVLSGGQDSTTCLFWAKNKFKEVHALTFNYGQRHRIEVESAKKVAELAKVTSHEILELPAILKGTSPLVNPKQVVEQYTNVESLPGGIEPTFIPGRNTLFLTLASNRAICLNTPNIVIGVCQADYGGYFDCRRDFINEMEKALSLGTFGEAWGFKIHTPLMYLTKRESIIIAQTLPGCMDALAYSHTCYNGVFPPCGSCHACLLRKRGFTEIGIEDPLTLRSVL